MNPTDTAWSRTTKYVVGVSLVLFAIFIVYLSREVVPPLIIAALIAVITRPVITWMHTRLHMARGLALAIVYLAVIILFPLALLLAVPAIVNAVHYVLSLDYPGILRSILEWLRSVLASIQTIQIPDVSLDAYVDQIITDLLASLQSPVPGVAPETPTVATILSSLGTALTTTFSTVTGLVGAVVAKVVLLIFILLASIYMNLSAHRVREGFLRMLPPGYRPEISLLMAQIGRLWSAFFRGELTLMLVIGIMSWLGLSVLGVRGALYLGIVAGLLELIPNLGPIISAIPAVIVALLQGSTYLPVSHLAMGALVIGLYILVQQLENSLIVPCVLGDAVDLPPLVVMTGVLVGATTSGILGALLATPIIATAREILRYVHSKMLGLDPFPPGYDLVKQGPASPIRLTKLLREWVQRLIHRRRSAQQDPAMTEPVPQSSSEPDGKDHPR